MHTPSEDKDTGSGNVEDSDFEEQALGQEDLDSVAGGNDEGCDDSNVADAVGTALGEVYDFFGGGGDGFGR